MLTLLTAAVAGYLFITRKFGAMSIVLAATLSGVAVSSLLKHLVARDRPDIVPHLSSVYTTSFPSGHSMLSAVVYLTLGSLLGRVTKSRRVKIYFLAVAMCLTVLIGVSRLYGRALSNRRFSRMAGWPGLGALVLDGDAIFTAARPSGAGLTITAEVAATTLLLSQRRDHLDKYQ